MNSDKQPTRIDQFDQLEEEFEDKKLIIASDPSKKEWQCTECGLVIEAKSRPPKCPHCNCVNADRKPGLYLFIPRDACGWFP